MERLITNLGYNALTIPNLDAKVVNYFIFLVIFEEFLNVALVVKNAHGLNGRVPKKEFF